MQSCWKHNAKPPTRPPTASQPFHPLLLPAVLHRSFCSCCCWPPNTNRNTSQRDAAPRQLLHPNIANKQSPPAAYVSAGFAMTSASAACRTQPATHQHRTHPPAAVWHGAVPLSRITPQQPQPTYPLLLAPVLVLPWVLLLLLLLAARLTLLACLPSCLTLPPLLLEAVLLEPPLAKLGGLCWAVVHQVERVLLQQCARRWCGAWEGSGGVCKHSTAEAGSKHLCCCQ